MNGRFGDVRYYGMQGGRFVRQVIYRLQMPEKTLAHELGVSRDAIAKWKSGETCPTREHMENLCHLLYRYDSQRKGPMHERRRQVNWRHELQKNWRRK